jgi:hypothetical protein
MVVGTTLKAGPEFAAVMIQRSGLREKHPRRAIKNHSILVAMCENEGYDILHKGVRRTFRDVKATAFEAARYAKSLNPKDLIEIVDRSTGTKLIMLEDGRTG